MAWKRWPQPQHRGVQLPDGGAPPEAVKGRAAQDHEQADAAVSGGPDKGPEFPAGSIEHSQQDNTPTLPSAKSGPRPVRQHNNAQEVTGGGLPDPERAKGFDQDEG
ncbi:MAG: hypothetical protein ABIP41_08835 [Croceibacterium sp.]